MLLPRRRFLRLAALLPGASAVLRAVLPDTGQTARHTRTFGEDSDYAGAGPRLRDNGDGTVSDEITGLMWQRVDGGEMTWDAALAYARDLRLAGRDDWRLPTSHELFGVLNHGRNRPPLDTRLFERSDAEYWWSATTRAGDTTRVWVANAGGGTGPHPVRETLSAGGEKRIHALCVRGAPPSPGPRLGADSPGTVKDQTTGLVWQSEAPAEPMSWDEALEYCSRLNLAGHGDWRLPNIKELRSLCDDAAARPLPSALFPRFHGGSTWTSTSENNRLDRAWHVSLDTGLVTHAMKTERLLVRAVRGGGAVAGPREKPPVDPELFRRSPGKSKDAAGKRRRDESAGAR